MTRKNHEKNSRLQGKSLAIYWSILTEPPATNDAIFDVNSRLNRNDWMKGYRLIKEYVEAAGGECHTLDVFQQKKQKPDVVLFLEAPSVPMEMILGEWSATVVKFVLLFECQVIQPRNWDVAAHSFFDKLFTWHDEFVDNTRCFKINFFATFPKKIQMDLRKKTTFCTLIAGSRGKGHPLELYSKRFEAISWFERYHPDEFVLYGIGWNKDENPSYGGTIECKNAVLEKCRFAICYENAQEIPGYITEKILDCFAAGCVPVYWGAPNVTQHIPADCFIDRRKFASHEELYDYMKQMTDEEYGKYLKNIQAFLDGAMSRQFRPEALAETIVEQWKESCLTNQSPCGSEARNLAVHFHCLRAVQARSQNDYAAAHEEICRAYQAGQAERVDFCKYNFIFIEHMYILLGMNQPQKVIEIGRQATEYGADARIDLPFLLMQAYLAIGDFENAYRYALQYDQLAKKYAKMPKDVYSGDHAVNYRENVTALLVKIDLQRGDCTNAVARFAELTTREALLELAEPIAKCCLQQKKTVELMKQVNERLEYYCPQAARAIRDVMERAEKLDESEFLEEIRSLRHAGRIEEALTKLAGYQLKWGGSLELLMEKAALYQEKNKR